MGWSIRVGQSDFRVGPVPPQAPFWTRPCFHTLPLPLPQWLIGPNSIAVKKKEILTSAEVNGMNVFQYNVWFDLQNKYINHTEMCGWLPKGWMHLSPCANFPTWPERSTDVVEKSLLWHHPVWIIRILSWFWIYELIAHVCGFDKDGLLLLMFLLRMNLLYARQVEKDTFSLIFLIIWMKPNTTSG